MNNNASSDNLADYLYNYNMKYEYELIRKRCSSAPIALEYICKCCRDKFDNIDSDSL